MAVRASGHHTGAPFQLPGLPAVPPSGRRAALEDEVRRRPWLLPPLLPCSAGVWGRPGLPDRCGVWCGSKLHGVLCSVRPRTSRATEAACLLRPTPKSTSEAAHTPTRLSQPSKPALRSQWNSSGRRRADPTLLTPGLLCAALQMMKVRVEGGRIREIVVSGG